MIPLTKTALLLAVVAVCTKRKLHRTSSSDSSLFASVFFVPPRRSFRRESLLQTKTQKKENSAMMMLSMTSSSRLRVGLGAVASRHQPLARCHGQVQHYFRPLTGMVASNSKSDNTSTTHSQMFQRPQTSPSTLSATTLSAARVRVRAQQQSSFRSFTSPSSPRLAPSRLKVAIVGSGPSGCYTAKYLKSSWDKKKGRVLEQASDNENAASQQGQRQQ